MANVMLKDTSASDTPSYRVYVDNIGAANISSAVFVPPAGSLLTVNSSTPDNATTPRSVVVAMSGAPIHGGTFQIVGSMVLSTGNNLVRSFTLRAYRV